MTDFLGGFAQGLGQGTKDLPQILQRKERLKQSQEQIDLQKGQAEQQKKFTALRIKEAENELKKQEQENLADEFLSGYDPTQPLEDYIKKFEGSPAVKSLVRRRGLAEKKDVVGLRSLEAQAKTQEAQAEVAPELFKKQLEKTDADIALNRANAKNARGSEQLQRDLQQGRLDLEKLVNNKKLGTEVFLTMYRARQQERLQKELTGIQQDNKLKLLDRQAVLDTQRGLRELGNKLILNKVMSEEDLTSSIQKIVTQATLASVGDMTNVASSLASVLVNSGTPPDLAAKMAGKLVTGLRANIFSGFQAYQAALESDDPATQRFGVKFIPKVLDKMNAFFAANLDDPERLRLGMASYSSLIDQMVKNLKGGANLMESLTDGKPPVGKTPASGGANTPTPPTTVGDTFTAIDAKRLPFMVDDASISFDNGKFTRPGVRFPEAVHAVQARLGDQAKNPLAVARGLSESSIVKRMWATANGHMFPFNFDHTKVEVFKTVPRTDAPTGGTKNSFIPNRAKSEQVKDPTLSPRPFILSLSPTELDSRAADAIDDLISRGELKATDDLSSPEVGKLIYREMIVNEIEDRGLSRSDVKIVFGGDGKRTPKKSLHK